MSRLIDFWIIALMVLAALVWCGAALTDSTDVALGLGFIATCAAFAAGRIERTRK